jgi:hypothetical protein
MRFFALVQFPISLEKASGFSPGFQPQGTSAKAARKLGNDGNYREAGYPGATSIGNR